MSDDCNDALTRLSHFVVGVLLLASILCFSVLSVFAIQVVLQIVADAIG